MNNRIKHVIAEMVAEARTADEETENRLKQAQYYRRKRAEAEQALKDMTYAFFQGTVPENLDHIERLFGLKE